MDLVPADVRMRLRSRTERRALAIVVGGLVGFVVAVYVVVVLGGGGLIGQTRSPDVSLSILATAVVALLFDRVQTALTGFATRTVRGGRPAPYDALSRFSRSVTGAYAAEELPSRMAMVLAEGTGAARAEVWLNVSGELTLAATWPPGAQPLPGSPSASAGVSGPGADGQWVQHVRHQGELLGVLRLQERAGQPLTPVEAQLFAGLGGQAAIALRGARLRAELAGQLAALSRREAELRASRERLVDTQDDERRRLERDIHDGAQQHLVALAVNLRLAETVAATSPQRAADVLAGQVDAAQQAIQTLSELSRGIYPRLLADRGLPAALSAAAASSPVPVRLVSQTTGRYVPSIEAALYFCTVEALQNVAKHADARRVDVTLCERGDVVEVVVEDDGRGLDETAFSQGTGLTSMRDRLDAVGGTLLVAPGATGGVAVRGVVPAQRIGAGAA
jgi:signal transduction histidine kinase